MEVLALPSLPFSLSHFEILLSNFFFKLKNLFQCVLSFSASCSAVFQRFQEVCVPGWAVQQLHVSDIAAAGGASGDSGSEVGIGKVIVLVLGCHVFVFSPVVGVRAHWCQMSALDLPLRTPGAWEGSQPWGVHSCVSALSFAPAPALSIAGAAPTP